MSEQFASQTAELTYAITSYTSEWIITGVLSLNTPIRLSDHLNRLEDEFLPLRETRIFNLEGERLEGALEGEIWHLHRDEILLLHEAPGQPRSGQDRSTDQRVEKQPHPILGYVGPFRLEGTVYLPPYARPDTFLDRMRELFVPLTAVSISLPAREDRWVVETPFALVRRTRLIVRMMEGGVLP